MKTIGLIGGMTWESSKMYYQYANEYVKAKLGPSHSAKVILNSVDFKEIENYTFANEWDKIGSMMADCAIQLEKAGADNILLCTNTIHLVSDYISKSVDLPFFHIADATGQAIQKKGLKKVALLGTKFTMEKDFYTNILRGNYNLEVVIPDGTEREVIHDIIYGELVKGLFTKESKSAIVDIINRLMVDGIEGVIMGCTELPILIPEYELSIPSIDTTKIHIQAALDWAID